MSLEEVLRAVSLGEGGRPPRHRAVPASPCTAAHVVCCSQAPRGHRFLPCAKPSREASAWDRVCPLAGGAAVTPGSREGAQLAFSFCRVAVAMAVSSVPAAPLEENTDSPGQRRGGSKDAACGVWKPRLGGTVQRAWRIASEGERTKWRGAAVAKHLKGGHAGGGEGLPSVTPPQR